MKEFIQLIKQLKPDKKYPSNNIDVSVNDDSFEAMHYTVYGDGINSVTDGIYEKETYDAKQLDAFITRKQKDGFIAFKREVCKEQATMAEYMDKFEKHISENPNDEEGLDKLVREGQNELKKIRTEDGKASERTKCLVVTSRDADEADGLLSAEIPGWPEKTFADKMTFLKNNFKFNMSSGFTQETDKEKIAKEDYYATLQYLISEAKDFGIVSVIGAKT